MAMSDASSSFARSESIWCGSGDLASFDSFSIDRIVGTSLVDFFLFFRPFEKKLDFGLENIVLKCGDFS